MAVYVIACITIEDRERYAEYERGFMPIFEKYRGRILAVEEQPQVLEGSWDCTRTVLIEFPTEADARAWYDSDEYAAIKVHRLAASTGNAILAKGLG
jgi:uncharacterized protein (DUF1330 family)